MLFYKTCPAKRLPYDNAVTENFFICLKCELNHLKQYPSRHAAKTDIFAYIEDFYNSLRTHSICGFCPFFRKGLNSLHAPKSQ